MPGWGRLRFWNGIWKAFPFVRSRHCAHASKELAHVFIGVSFRLLALQPLHSRLSWGGIHARRRLVPDRPEGHACSSCTRSRTGKVTRENSFLLRLSGFRHAIARVACAAPSVVLWSLRVRVRVHALGTADKRGRKETLGVPKAASLGPGSRFYFFASFSSTTASCVMNTVTRHAGRTADSRLWSVQTCVEAVHADDERTHACAECARMRTQTGMSSCSMTGSTSLCWASLVRCW